MSTPRKLRLGPLPRTETVKITITLGKDLKARLDQYAQLHAEIYGDPVDAASLIPHMLHTFITKDREFKATKGRELP